MNNINPELIVIGGGTSGCASAISAAREGINTLLIEELGYLGGTATATYVTPMMKTILPDGTNLSGGLYLEVLEYLNKLGYAQTNFDNNPGWFAPEMMKFVLDELALQAGVKILFHTKVFETKVLNNKITELKGLNAANVQVYTADFYIDATGDATVAAISGVPYDIGYNGKSQALSHRFVMANVNIEKFAEWLKNFDPDINISPVFTAETGDILLTTAYTSEDKGWPLKELFLDAIKNNILKPYDAEYFQLFTAPGQKGLVYFNCPRIYSEKPLSPLDPYDITFAQITGRKQILRLATFCNFYLKGFENAYISNIANNIGIRDSRRIKGKYTITNNDIITCRKFSNAIAKSNYPIDIHSIEKNTGGLTHLKPYDYYEIPRECIETNEINNLLVVGKAISADFSAQASLRIQPTCWSIGEAAGKYAAMILKNIKS